MPKRQAQGTTRKLIAFEGEAWQAIQPLARDQKRTLQDLADEAFADLLRKRTSGGSPGGAALKLTPVARKFGSPSA